MIVEVSCLVWSLLNTTLPSLSEVELGWRTGGAGAAARYLNSANGTRKHPRTTAEVSDFIANVVKGPSISETVKVDICVPILVFLPFFLLPNIFSQPTLPTPAATTTPHPTILSQYTIRPLPTPPHYWEPHRNLTKLPNTQIYPDLVTYKSQVNYNPITTTTPPATTQPTQPIYIDVESDNTESKDYIEDNWADIPPESDLTSYEPDLLTKYGQTRGVGSALDRDMIWRLIRGAKTKEEGSLQFSGSEK